MFDNLDVILCGVVGSTAFGCSVGSDDHDEMGIFIEKPSQVMGLTSHDHEIYRDRPQGVRSQPGDLDLTLYSLRKFCRLAMKGNPHVIMLLWLPEFINKRDPVAQTLIDIRKHFINKQTFSSFIGYLKSQKMGMLGQRSKKVSRPELVDKYGFDTKFAYHAIRLGMQGCELGLTDNLVLPMCEAVFLKDVRLGRVSFDECIRIIESHETRLLDYLEEAKPAEQEPIDKFLVWAHRIHWELCGYNGLIRGI